jgi:hypothetical protein
LVTELTRKLVGANGIRFRDRGEYPLKGLKGLHLLYEVEWTE